MIKKIKEFFKKDNRPFDYGAVTEEHIKKYYSNPEKHIYRRMLSYAMRHKKLFIPSFIISILYTIINILPPFFGQLAISITGGKRVDLLDKIPFVNELATKFTNFNTKQLAEQFLSTDSIGNPVVVAQFAFIIIIGFIYVIFRVSFDYLKTFLFQFTAQEIGKDVRADMLKGLMNTDIAYFKQEKEGDIISRVLNESGTIEGFLSGTLPNMITVPLTLVLTLAVLLLLNVKLTLACFIAAPLIGLGIDKVSKLIKTRVTSQQNLLGSTTSIIQEDIRGIEVIKIFSKEDQEVKRYKSIYSELINLMRKISLLTSLNRPMTELVMIAAMLIILAYGGFLIFKGEMPFEFLWGFLLYMLNISTPVRDLSGIFINLQMTKMIARRVFEIIDLPPENVDDPNKKQMKPIEHSITFENVSFEYPKRNDAQPFHLGPINFKVKKGDVVAFVGNSGGGKTTLISLIPKLFTPSSGVIRFDGIDINELNTRSVRNQIGVVSQENILFYGTVRENILYANPDATDDDLVRAAKIAHADEFILKLPNGYDTHIGPRGIMLSGGQRQRIALARAVLKRPSILILDEATSALDTESEMYVQKALNEIINLQTTFVIAHRLSTIKNATYICVVENGQITESGTHEELMKKGGKYQYLYSLQFRD
ncbi:ABC transporter ATP-binding protein [Brachyspira pilosicoli]|uniref:ABC transporter transmembrane region n=3 Tax=Brachyspira pilosicoli TaxID=52584 RepID=A0A3B6VQJ0_BRAPL|nr:ABC transporter ATP-binding protein [Brachyspira pilosicoli]AFR70607.1 ABC-type multidrug transport system, ATPase and permease component [Brachyspira pilosicoli B2904]AGA65935.1 ABC transporter transmembrane region [Brachyspira pilosicoli P43/6/78]MBW5391352.1 ABC transporter ATP-binding protein [Brachyspira pilosicoli]MBW5399840.1 ABC transporter ATP-binding protein [Brachyspira pilosicoli]WIH84155.1 ABC transporter ATP-binding protein/permease [Brachyspira pilosicoli]